MSLLGFILLLDSADYFSTTLSSILAKQIYSVKKCFQYVTAQNIRESIFLKKIMHNQYMKKNLRSFTRLVKKS